MSFADELRKKSADVRDALFWTCAERMYTNSIRSIKDACTEVATKVGKSTLKAYFPMQIPDDFPPDEANILASVLADNNELLYTPSYRAFRKAIIDTFEASLRKEGMNVRKCRLDTGDGTNRLYLHLTW